MTALVVLVTGTDTGVGKTVVTCGLARGLARQGRRVAVVKPVESGCEEVPDDGEDGVRLARAAGQDEPATALSRLRALVAPPVAADREGAVLDHRPWCEAIRRLAYDREFVLVEGAGGLLSPLTWEASARDLAVDLGAGALVVAPDRLGCLNHVRMTLEVLEGDAVRVLGVVFSAPEATDDSTGTNANALRRLEGGVRTAVLPRVHDPDEAAEHLKPVLEWLDS